MMAAAILAPHALSGLATLMIYQPHRPPFREPSVQEPTALTKTRGAADRGSYAATLYLVVVIV